jgi:protein-S-isoprenylcysteine O-methyltransferase Ste14
MPLIAMRMSPPIMAIIGARSMLVRLMVWLGGAVFVGSLGFCAWAYLITWSTPAGSAMSWRALAVNALLLTVFATHHSLFARDGVKRWLSQAIPPALLRSFYVWIASVLFVAVIWFWQPVGGDIYRLSGWSAWIGAAVQLLGIWLIVQSVRAIDALDLAGIRQATPTPAVPAPPALVVRGPYRIVRHPLYLGWVLVTFGTAHLTGDRLAFAALTTLYLIVAVPWEERSLAGTFGDEYARYSARVRWRMLPYLY